MDPWESAWIVIRHANLYPCAPSWRIAPKVATYDDIFYIERGYGWLERDGERFDAQPGDLFITRTGRRMSAGHDPKRPITCYSTGFNVYGPGNVDVLRAMSFPDRLRLSPRQRRGIEECFSTLVAEMREPGPHAKLAARGALLSLLAETFRLCEDLPASARAGGLPPVPGETTRVGTVLAHIETNLAKRLTLNELAKVAHLSPVYFASFFRAQTGQPPMAYVRQRRIEAARALLMSNDDSIENIARAVGYPDPFLFSRVFRRTTGMAPSAYRASFKNPFAQ